MALLRLLQGKIYDPTCQKNGVIEDIYIENERIVGKPPDENTTIHETIDLTDKIVMAGAIDIHSHIGGGKINIARLLLPEFQTYSDYPILPSAEITGCRYIQMGYTAAFEPAMLPSNARQTHLEMNSISFINKGAYALLGNDDFLLKQLARKASVSLIQDYLAWMLSATKSLAIKVVNPGGINAFKFNQRALDLDEAHHHYGTTPRQIIYTLAKTAHDLGLPHPLHLHANNLGTAGNIETTLKTISASEGYPLHLAHVQFHSYGKEGDKKFSSAGAQIAEAINDNLHITADIGQVLFNQTVTVSADTQHQHKNIIHAHPKKTILMDIEYDAGCGVVPFRYRDQNFVNALQWVVGLEIFLLVNDPWRIFLTTDHPNGAPFTSYPHLIKLLMNKTFRQEKLLQIHPDVRQVSTLMSIEREYSLYEIATMTRAAPAKILGLKDQGHLQSGGLADIVIYQPQEDIEQMFSKPYMVFKNGNLVVRNGKIIGQSVGKTYTVRPPFDSNIEKVMADYFDDNHTVSADHFKLRDDEIFEKQIAPV